MTNNLPDTTTGPRPRSSILDESDVHVIEVTRHDTRDIINGRQYFALFLDNATDGRYICSNITTPLQQE